MTQSEFAYLKLLREKYNKQAIMEISLKNLKLVKLKNSPSIKKNRESTTSFNQYSETYSKFTDLKQIREKS